MAFVCLVIDVPAESIAQLNVIQAQGNPHVAVVNARNLADAILGGCKDASVQITVRSTDPAIATAGTGSTQLSYNLK